MRNNILGIFLKDLRKTSLVWIFMVFVRFLVCLLISFKRLCQKLKKIKKPFSKRTLTRVHQEQLQEYTKSKFQLICPALNQLVSEKLSFDISLKFMPVFLVQLAKFPNSSICNTQYLYTAFTLSILQLSVTLSLFISTYISKNVLFNVGFIRNN